MPQATSIAIHDVASLANLAAATWRAAAGKRDRRDVLAFIAYLDRSLTRLSRDLLSGAAPVNQYRSFTIRDPKRRTIHAPVFRDRVVHHALMAHAGPELTRRLIFDSYACRVGKGNLAAVMRAQFFARRYRWYGKLDVRGYFHSIHHGVLKAALRRCIKGSALPLCHRIIDGFETTPGRGLPIGALSSQYFANWYLGVIDRLLSDAPGVRAVVRYMLWHMQTVAPGVRVSLHAGHHSTSDCGLRAWTEADAHGHNDDRVNVSNTPTAWSVAARGTTTRATCGQRTATSTTPRTPTTTLAFVLPERSGALDDALLTRRSSRPWRLQALRPLRRTASGSRRASSATRDRIGERAPAILCGASERGRCR